MKIVVSPIGSGFMGEIKFPELKKRFLQQP